MIVYDFVEQYESIVASTRHASVRICKPIVEQIISGNFEYSYECECAQFKAKSEINIDRQNREKQNLQSLLDNLGVRVFNPHAASNSNTDNSKCYRKHEKEKKRQ